MNAAERPPLDPDRLRTPALVIDLATARRNIAATLAEAASTARWRPHVKTAKVPEVMALYLEAGLRRFKCATLREAEELMRCGGSALAPEDILVAHHLHGPALEALADVAARFPTCRWSTLVESSEQVERVPNSVDVFIDVDLGMNRTGLDVARLDDAVEIARRAGPRFRGLHAYDGHRHEADRVERESLAHAGYRRVLNAASVLEAAGAPAREVITCGTPAYPAGLSFQDWNVGSHSISPGTVVYHDLRSQSQLAPREVEFAATVWTRVASLPSDDLFTVDAGSKAIEAASPNMIARIIELPGARALRQSEEHTVFQIDKGERPARGTLLRLVPGHVCPTVNLASRCVLTEEDRFLGEVAVTARGH
ncbi:MAG: alanine racemase [Planctomycetota bacterium]